MISGKGTRLRNSAAPSGPDAFRPVGQFLGPAQHADRERLAALGAGAALLAGPLRFHPDAALAMPVDVVLALLWEELDRSRVPGAGFQCPPDAK